MSVCYYGPDGQCEIFEDGTTCPKGWADHPSLVDPLNIPTASEATLVEAAKKFDHDGDGKPGGSRPRRKKAVSNDHRQ